jgi:hypothetical protein
MNHDDGRMNWLRRHSLANSLTEAEGIGSTSNHNPGIWHRIASGARIGSHLEIESDTGGEVVKLL